MGRGLALSPTNLSNGHLQTLILCKPSMDFIILISSTSPRAETFRKHLSAYSARYRGVLCVFSSWGASMNFLTRYNGDLREPEKHKKNEPDLASLHFF